MLFSLASKSAKPTVLRSLVLRTTTATTNLSFFKKNPPVRPAVSAFNPRRRVFRPSFATMASGGQQFPPQTQERQPGKEHVMEPTPQAVHHDYKAANKLQGNVELVTGGDSGIGRAVCYCFAMEGATVAFTYVKSQEDKDAEDTLQMLRGIKRGTNAKDPIAIPADLGFEENCRKVVEEVAGTYGRIDILVNNAAEQYINTCITDISEEQLERVFRTNIISYFLATKSSKPMNSLTLPSFIIIIMVVTDHMAGMVQVCGELST